MIILYTCSWFSSTKHYLFFFSTLQLISSVIPREVTDVAVALNPAPQTCNILEMQVHFSPKLTAQVSPAVGPQKTVEELLKMLMSGHIFWKPLGQIIWKGSFEVNKLVILYYQKNTFTYFLTEQVGVKICCLRVLY